MTPTEPAEPGAFEGITALAGAAMGRFDKALQLGSSNETLQSVMAEFVAIVETLSKIDGAKIDGVLSENAALHLAAACLVHRFATVSPDRMWTPDSEVVIDPHTITHMAGRRVEIVTTQDPWSMIVKVAEPDAG